MVGVDIVVRDKDSITVLTKIERRLIHMSRQFDNLQKVTSRYSGTAARTASATDEMGKRMRKVAQTTSLLHSRLGQVVNLATSLGPAAMGAAAALYGLFKSVQALARAFAEAVKQGTAFEKGIAEIQTISEAAEFPVARIREMITGLATQFGVGITTGTKSLYQAISSGAMTAADAQGVLEASSVLTIGALTTMSNAVDVVTGSINAYYLEGLTAAEVTSALFTTVRYGVTTGEQLARNLGNVTSMASTAGVSFQELNAALATLTKRGIRTQKATIQLRQIFSSLVKVTPIARAEAKRLGIEFDTLAVREKGFLGLLKEIQNNSKFTATTFGKLFGNTRALAAVMSLMIDRGKEFEENLIRQATETDNATRALNIMQGTTDQLANRISATGEAITATFGDAVVRSEGVKEFLRIVLERVTQLHDLMKNKDFLSAIDTTMRAVGQLAKGVLSAFDGVVWAMELIIKNSVFFKAMSTTATAISNLVNRNRIDVEPLEYRPPAWSKDSKESQVVKEFAARQLAQMQQEQAEREARLEEKREEARKAQAEADRVRRRMDQASEAAVERLLRMYQQIVKLQERGAEIWQKLNQDAADSDKKKAIGDIADTAKRSGNVVEMAAAIERLAKMREDVDRGLEALRGGLLMAKDDLNAAKTEQEARDALQQVEEFAARYKDLRQEMQEIDRATDTLQDEIARKQEERVKKQVKSYEEQRRAMTQVAQALIGNLGALGREMISFEGTSKELTKTVTKRFVQMAGDMISAMIRVAAVEKATAVQTVVANGAKAGSAVGADAAGKFGIFATVIAPPLIAAMVGMITALLDKFHEGGTMGNNGQRLPLNLGPGEYATIMRRGEVTIPSARSTVPVDSSGPPVELHYHGHMLTDPSRARFTRHLDEDVAPALAGSISAGRVSLSNQRLYGRKS